MDDTNEKKMENQPAATPAGESTAPTQSKAAVGNPNEAEELREALRVVNDPEIGLNVVQLGLIREINLNADEGEIKMMLTTPFCPYGGWLIQQVKDTAEQFAGRKVNVVVLPDLWDPNYMEDPGLLMGW